MKDEQKVWIRGVEGRGDEVLRMLVNRGATTQLKPKDFERNDYIYFITHAGDIGCMVYESEVGKIIMDNYRELHLPERWKDGDVLISNDGGFFCIFRRYEPDYFFYAYLEVSDNICKENPKWLFCFVGCYRLATPAEVDRFHELLHKHGKKWDAEKKQLVKWRWKPKNEEAYYFIDTNTSVYEIAYDENNINDSINFEVGNCFRTREEAEAMAKKFKKLLKGGEK